ncbi:MAG TPA: DUF2892 domain-containing protein [Pirellulales bacterium]|nr:DUF2892 domain-containing protein [Pirellulales bacterium]
MTIERALRLVAGLVVLVSIALAVLHSPFWLVLTAFVALNLLQSAFSDWCPMVWVLQKLGLPRCGQRSSLPQPPLLGDSSINRCTTKH